MKIDALKEVGKDLLRWLFSYGFAWITDNGAVILINILLKTDAKPSLETQVFVTALFKYADYWYHRYRKEQAPGLAGQSLGIIGF